MRETPEVRTAPARRLPRSAQIFEEMAGEEDSDRAALIEEHRRRFGDAIP